jgi:hypothetical protein
MEILGLYISFQQFETWVLIGGAICFIYLLFDVTIGAAMRWHKKELQRNAIALRARQQIAEMDRQEGRRRGQR